MANFRIVFVLAALFISACSMMSQGPNLTGEWEVTMDTPMGAQSAPMTLVQNGNELSGTTSDPFGNEVEIAGMIEGSDVHYSYSVNGPAGAIELTFEGMLENDMIKGTAAFGAFGEGDFTAERK